jgi:mannose-1-phosphate guanylyltransferase
VKEAFINLHHLPENVYEHFGDGTDWGIKITYHEERQLLGTAGGLKSFETSLRQGPFIVIYADNLSNCSLRDIYRYHLSHSSLVTMSLCWLDDPISCGIAALDDHGRIVRYQEKPQRREIFSNLINAGIYVFEPAVLDYIEAGVNSDLSLDVLPKIIRDGQPMFGFEYKGYILKFDRPSDWDRSLAFLEHQSSGYEPV